MTRQRLLAPLFAILFLCGAALAGQSAKAQNEPDASRRPMSQETRYTVIRGLNAEFVFARRLFPMGSKGLTLKDGQIAPNDFEVRSQVAQYGAAARPGDRAQITNVDIREHSIIFEINGGPKKKKKWYQHIEVGGMGGMTPIAPDTNPQNPHGSYVTLAFDRFVPDLTVDQLKKLLGPVFDFSSLSATQAYIETLPPKTRAAIKNHQALVGMNRQMVEVALGRAPKKIRERDEHGAAYEEWIYGEPPQDVSFIRLVGDEVTRVEVMKVDGQKVVRTEREVDLPQSANPSATAAANLPATPAKAPTLRRPGEELPPQATRSATPAPLPPPIETNPTPPAGNVPH